MRRLGLAFAPLILAAAPALAQEVGGMYGVYGTNFDGSTYEGTAEIVLLSETTCAIMWTTGDTTSQGTCMRRNNTFAAGYDLQGKIGLLIYDILKDGSMEGAWTVTGMDGFGTETLTPMR
jgi:hypothetical protein